MAGVAMATVNAAQGFVLINELITCCGNIFHPRLTGSSRAAVLTVREE